MQTLTKAPKTAEAAVKAYGKAVSTHNRESIIARLPKGSRGVEVGVWKGDFSREILDAITPSKLYLIDPWELNDDQTNRTSTVDTTQDALDAVHSEVVERFKAWSSVNVCRARSDEAAASWQEPPVDWVYVDSIHTFPATYETLAEWWPHIKPGGLACGDDCWRPDVAEAAKVFAELVGCTLTIKDSQFVIEKAVA